MAMPMMIMVVVVMVMVVIMPAMPVGGAIVRVGSVILRKCVLR
ncbi:hypothetical protein D8I24_8200 [Cupriavidus necator H850]|jgi:hypothetical protein|nr:hypothetical protein D8I24_8200 [Cupriavidus necator H850]